MRVHHSFSYLLVLSLGACGGGGNADAGMDAGRPPPRDAGDDSGRCTEFTPEYCPRVYDPSPITADQVCDVFVDAFCRANGLCCSDDSRVYPSFDDCRRDQLARCEDDLIGFEFPARIAAEIVEYSQGAAGGEFANVATMGDMCIPIRYGDQILDIYRGTIEGGLECTHSVECDLGLICVAAGGFSTCVSEPDRTSSCETTADCEAGGLRCNAGTCDFRLDLDEECVEDDDCATLNCQLGFCYDATPDSTYCVDVGGTGPAFE